MDVAWKTVRVFISSTFSDMHAERDYLVKRVFPKLRAWCERRCLHLIDVDLRWGVSREVAESDSALEVCLREIDDSRPFFVCMLGSRYGSLPRDSRQEYRSITHLEILHATEQSMRLDSSERWSACRHTFFYIRDPDCLPDPNTAALSPEQREEYVNNYFEIDSEKKRKLNVLKRRIRKLEVRGAKATAYRGEWDWQARNPGAESFSGCLTKLEEFGQAVENDLKRAIKVEFSEHINASQQAGNKGLMEHLLQQSFVESRTRVHILREDVEGQLNRYLVANTRRPIVVYGAAGSGKSATLAHWIDEKLAEQTETAKRKRSWLDTIAESITDTQQLRNEYHARPRETSCFYLGRFVGASPSSMQLPKLIREICERLIEHFDLCETDDGHGISAMTAPRDDASLRSRWPSILAAAGERGNVVLVVDGVDQLDTSAAPIDMAWIPPTLPDGVKVVVGVSDDRPVGADRSQSSGWLANFIAAEFEQARLKPLNEDQQAALIDALPRSFSKEFESHQRELLVNNEATRNPLFLAVALEELRQFGHYARLDEKLEALPSVQDSENQEELALALEALFDRVLSGLERETVDEASGLVEAFFAILASSVQGLSEKDMDGALSRALPDLGDTPRKDMMNYVLRRVSAYILRRGDAHGSTIDFRYRSFRNAARLRYFKNSQELRWRELLFEYWDAQPFKIQGVAADVHEIPNLRKLSELPEQIERALGLNPSEPVQRQLLQTLFRLMTDWRFLNTHARLGRLPETIRLFGRVLKLWPGDATDRRVLLLLRHAIQIDASYLQRYPYELFPSLQNRFRGVTHPFPELSPSSDDPTAAAVLASIRSIFKQWESKTQKTNRPKLRCLSPPAITPCAGPEVVIRSVWGEVSEFALSADGSRVFVVNDGQLLQIFSTEDGSEISNLQLDLSSVLTMVRSRYQELERVFGSLDEIERAFRNDGAIQAVFERAALKMDVRRSKLLKAFYSGVDYYRLFSRIAASPNGRDFAFGQTSQYGSNESLAIWSLATRSEVWSSWADSDSENDEDADEDSESVAFVNYESTSHAIRFSCDGKTLWKASEQHCTVAMRTGDRSSHKSGNAFDQRSDGESRLACSHRGAVYVVQCQPYASPESVMAESELPHGAYDKDNPFYVPPSRPIWSEPKKDRCRLWIFCASTESLVGQWEIPAIPQQQLFAAGSTGKLAMAWQYKPNPDLKTIDSSILLYDVTAQRAMRGLNNDEGFDVDSILTMGFCDNDRKLWIGRKNGQFDRFDVSSGELELQCKLPFEVKQAAVFSDGARIACIPAERGSVEIWNVEEYGEAFVAHAGYTNAITDFRFSPDGATLTTSSKHDEGVFVWDTDTGVLLRRLDCPPFHERRIDDLAYEEWGGFFSDSIEFYYSTTGTMLLVDYGYWAVHELTTGDIVVSVEDCECSNLPSGFTPDGNHILMGAAGELFHIPSRRSLKLQPEDCHFFDQSVQGEFLLCKSYESIVVIWRLPNCEAFFHLSDCQGFNESETGYFDFKSTCRLSRNGTRLAIRETEDCVQVFDVDSKTRVCKTPKFSSPIQMLDISENGDRLVCVHKNGRLSLSCGSTGKLLGNRLIPLATESVDFADDGHIVVDSRYGCVRIDGERLQWYKLHTENTDPMMFRKRTQKNVLVELDSQQVSARLVGGEIFARASVDMTSVRMHPDGDRFATINAQTGHPFLWTIEGDIPKQADDDSSMTAREHLIDLVRYSTPALWTWLAMAVLSAIFLETTWLNRLFFGPIDGLLLATPVALVQLFRFAWPGLIYIWERVVFLPASAAILVILGLFSFVWLPWEWVWTTWGSGDFRILFAKTSLLIAIVLPCLYLHLGWNTSRKKLGASITVRNLAILIAALALAPAAFSGWMFALLLPLLSFSQTSIFAKMRDRGRINLRAHFMNLEKQTKEGKGLKEPLKSVVGELVLMLCVAAAGYLFMVIAFSIGFALQSVDAVAQLLFGSTDLRSGVLQINALATACAWGLGAFLFLKHFMRYRVSELIVRYVAIVAGLGLATLCCWPIEWFWILLKQDGVYPQFTLLTGKALACAELLVLANMWTFVSLHDRHSNLDDEAVRTTHAFNWNSAAWQFGGLAILILAPAVVSSAILIGINALLIMLVIYRHRLAREAFS